MSQHDYDIENSLFPAFRTNINAAIMALVTQNSNGNTEPSPTHPFMGWAHEATDLYKIRNAADTAWVPVFVLSTGAPVTGGGDMLASIYDPGNVAGDAFSMDNMVEGVAKILTSAERTKLGYLAVTQNVDLDQMETDIAALANGMVYKDSWDASAGSFPGAGSAEIGWFYTVSVAGTVDGVEFAVDDRLIAKVDNASATTYAGNWTKVDATDAVQSVAGLVGAITAPALRSALNVEDGADVTDATNVDAAGALMKAIGTAKGNIIAFTGSGAPVVLPVGTNGYVLSVDSAEPSGIKWVQLAGGGDMLASTYDPGSVSGDAFSMDNMVEGAAKILTAAERTKLGYLTVTQNVDLDQMETDIAALANGMVYKDSWDASAGSFPGAGAAETGWFYTVSVAGTVDGVEFAVDDRLIAKVDNASTTTYAGNWTKLDATDAVQSVAGLVGAITAAALRSALNVEDGADVTDATNVEAAGALMAGSSGNLTVGFTTDIETLASNTITPDLTAEWLKVRAVTGNVTINEPADGSYGGCVILLSADASGPYTVTLGAGVSAVGTIPDLAASTEYQCLVIKHSDTLTTVEITGIG